MLTPLLNWRTCYNSDGEGGEGTEGSDNPKSLCTRLVEGMTEAYENEAAAREACMGILGAHCDGQCRLIASLFDAPQYNPDAKNSESSWPLSFGAKQLKVTLTHEACASCLRDGACYPQPTMPDNW